MHLPQHKLCKRKTEPAFERKFHLDFTNTDTAVMEGCAYPTRRRSSGGAWRSCCRRLVQPWSIIRNPRPTSSPWPPERGSGAEWRRRYRPPDGERKAGSNIVIGPPSHETIVLWVQPCPLLLPSPNQAIN